jgi:hypothetical protein
MQVYEGSTLTFDVPAIFRELDYDLVVRYEHQPNHPAKWETAKVRTQEALAIAHMGNVKPAPCAV